MEWTFMPVLRFLSERFGLPQGFNAIFLFLLSFPFKGLLLGVGKCQPGSRQVSWMEFIESTGLV